MTEIADIKHLRRKADEETEDLMTDSLATNPEEKIPPVAIDSMVLNPLDWS